LTASPDGLLGLLAGWTGRRTGEPLDDDVTIVMAEVRRLPLEA
jgi:hypothetical protein